MEREAAIRANQAAMDALARISEEIQELDWLIVVFGQPRYYNPRMVARLSRIRTKLIEEKTEQIAVKDEAAQYI